MNQSKQSIIRSICVKAVVFAGLLGASAQAGDLLRNEDLQQLGLSELWSAKLPIQPGDFVRDAYLTDDALFVVTQGGTLFALQIDVGLIRWVQVVSGPNLRIFQPSYVLTHDGSGPLIVPTSSQILVLDRYTGRRLATLEPKFSRTSTVVGLGNAMFVGSTDEKLRALLWLTSIAPPPVQLWHVHIGGVIESKPIIFDGSKILFATSTGTVFACGASNKQFLWNIRIGGSIVANPAMDLTGAYVGSTNQSLVKIDVSNGRRVWRYPAPGPLRTAPIVTGGTVYQFCEGYGLIVIDADSGSELWRQANGKTLLTQLADRSYVLCNTGDIAVVSTRNGKLVSTLGVDGLIVPVPNTKDQALYVVATDGRVLAARASGTPYLRAYQIQAARATMNIPPTKRPTAIPMGITSSSSKSNNQNDPFRSLRDIQK